MRIAPTLNGGLRIDAGGPGDWEVLRCIVLDARWGGRDLARRLGGLIHDEQDPGDWEEFVVPELQAAFEGQLTSVAQAIEQAARQCGGQAGPLLVGREDAEAWYGALNQARLALEAEHSFGPRGEAPGPADPVRRSAYFRSQFYLAVQQMLLDRVLPRA